MKENRKLYWWIGISIIFILSIPVIVYALKFRNSNISKNTSDWGAFADYINPFIALCTLIIITYITIYVHRNSLFVEKPMIIFKLNKEMTNYIIKNVGKGPAMNIILKHKDKRFSVKWDSATKCYSLGPQDELEIFWHKGGDEWYAIYEDIFLTHYFSDLKNDVLTYDILEEQDYKIEIKDVDDRLWDKVKSV